MFNWFKRRERKIAFIDGDQPLHQVLAAYDKHIAKTNTETHLVRMKESAHKEPYLLRKVNGINKIYLEGFSVRKEVVDKFIGAYIQRAVSEGYTHITVVSSDYDFIEIFKMAVMIDNKASNITFRMIIPNARGRAAELPEKLLNIEIIK